MSVSCFSSFIPSIQLKHDEMKNTMNVIIIKNITWNFYTDYLKFHKLPFHNNIARFLSRNNIRIVHDDFIRVPNHNAKLITESGNIAKVLHLNTVVITSSDFFSWIWRTTVEQHRLKRGHLALSGHVVLSRKFRNTNNI